MCFRRLTRKGVLEKLFGGSGGTRTQHPRLRKKRATVHLSYGAILKGILDESRIPFSYIRIQARSVQFVP